MLLVLRMLLLLPGCPALTTPLLLLLLLLLLPSCPTLIMLPLLLSSPVSITNSRRVTSAAHVLSGGREIPVST